MRGLPHNLMQFTTLQEVLAGWIGAEIGTYQHWSDSLHVYESDLGEIGVGGLEEEPNTDDLVLPLEESQSQLGEVERRMRQMSQNDLLPSELEILARSFDGQRGYLNWLLVAGAEAARRRGWQDLSGGLVGDCSNPAFRQLWDRWASRWRGP